jgi:adenosylcobyric acid synthase
MIIGICGGFQMLGKAIRDPFGLESPLGEVEGLGILDLKTTLRQEKLTFQVKAVPLHDSFTSGDGNLHGYEIHMGDTERGASHRAAFKIVERLGRAAEIEDGAVSPDGRVWGTYLHGLFENDRFRRRLIESMRGKKGQGEGSRGEELNYRAFKEKEYDKLAAALREALDMERIYRIIGVERAEPRKIL